MEYFPRPSIKIPSTFLLTSNAVPERQLLGPARPQHIPSFLANGKVVSFPLLCWLTGMAWGSEQAPIRPLPLTASRPTAQVCSGFGPRLQRPPSSQSRGFKDHVLESSHGWLAAKVVSYCPSRTSELQPTVITKHSD